MPSGRLRHVPLLAMLNYKIVNCYSYREKMIDSSCLDILSKYVNPLLVYYIVGSPFLPLPFLVPQTSDNLVTSVHG